MICEVVFAELSPGFSSIERLESKLDDLGVTLEPIGARAAFLAGKTYGKYLQAGGPRKQMIPDFLIGAHAEIQAGRLAAADRGYVRKYFGDLELLTLD